MNTQNSETNGLPARPFRAKSADSDVAQRLFAALLAALAAAWTTRAAACDLDVAAGSTVRLNGDFAFDCVTVGADGRLIIAGGTLTLTADATSAVGGSIILESCDSVLRITDDHNFSGDGCISGQCESAGLEIAGGKTLTSAITIQGMLQIRPAAGASSTTFVNAPGGLVHANAAGTLDVRPHGVHGAGDWQVSTSASAVLQFTTSTSDLVGRFDVDAGLLGILGQVCTTGVLDYQGGEIAIASSGCFGAGGSCPCGG
jgi:hypothetical protein